MAPLSTHAHPQIVKVVKGAELGHLFRQKLLLSQLQLSRIRKTKPLGKLESLESTISELPFRLTRRIKTEEALNRMATYAQTTLI